ncbi:hypothetical protein CERZMDRAFT_81783 [Cercospora zeae-maydis SCOH1-5]|uniref:Uncharacterized protein n=1 Tax=Cercospora zeae-maydis SCOH1-5 TaxID=717836 RepID=A0A6A6FQQ6_9PEZI|nr:hypothetical protein CERZMDRAFT_81783 [Cercospora zeae-maydis SCOH1-5]
MLISAGTSSPQATVSRSSRGETERRDGVVGIGVMVDFVAVLMWRQTGEFRGDDTQTVGPIRRNGAQMPWRTPDLGSLQAVALSVLVGRMQLRQRVPHGGEGVEGILLYVYRGCGHPVNEARTKLLESAQATFWRRSATRGCSRCECPEWWPVRTGQCTTGRLSERLRQYGCPLGCDDGGQSCCANRHRNAIHGRVRAQRVIDIGARFKPGDTAGEFFEKNGGPHRQEDDWPAQLARAARAQRPASSVDRVGQARSRQ